MAVGEQQHVVGEDGTKDARQWLERTTRVRVLFDAYDNASAVQLPLLTGKWEGWDMMGVLLDENGSNGNVFYAECKKHNSDSKAGTGYEEFVRNCYSATAQKQKTGDPGRPDFLFITWHPFKVTSWKDLCTAGSVESFVKAKVGTPDDVLGTDTYDPKLGSEVAKRLWLVVLHDRQIVDLSMSGTWLGKIRDEQTDKTKPKAAK